MSPASQPPAERGQEGLIAVALSCYRMKQRASWPLTHNLQGLVWSRAPSCITRGDTPTPCLLYLPAFAMCWPPEIPLPPSPPIAQLFFLQNTSVISLPEGPQRGPQEGLLAGADITGPAHTPWIWPICCVQPVQLPALVSLRPEPFYRTATACSFCAHSRLKCPSLTAPGIQHLD